MKNQSGKRREIYIPVNTVGDPWHWNVCILTIDESDQTSLTYLETFPLQGRTYKSYLNFYKKEILPGINQLLHKQGFARIAETSIHYDVSKQFAEHGCAIATSVNIQKLINGSLSPKSAVDTHPGLSIEEDSVRRAQLAIKITMQDQYITQWYKAFPEHQQLSPMVRYRQEEVLRELKTHPYILKQRAAETFPQSGLRQVPVKPVSKLPATSEPAVMPESDFDLNLINEYESKFNGLLDKLEDMLAWLAKKQKHANYHDILLSVSHLGDILKKEMDVFFKSPTADIYQQSRQKCKEAIQDTMKEAAKHRGWHCLNPILKGLLGVFAGLTLIPALAIEFGTKQGYLKIFFAKPPTETLKRMEGFNKQYEQDTEPLDEQEMEHNKKENHDSSGFHAAI